MRMLRSLPWALYMGLAMVGLAVYTNDVRGVYIAVVLFAAGTVQLVRADRS